MTVKQGEAELGPAMQSALSNPQMTDLGRKCLKNEFDREIESQCGGAPKMHPAHVVTDHGIEINPVGYSRNPDGSKRSK